MEIHRAEGTSFIEQISTSASLLFSWKLNIHNKTTAGHGTGFSLVLPLLDNTSDSSWREKRRFLKQSVSLKMTCRYRNIYLKWDKFLKVHFLLC